MLNPKGGASLEVAVTPLRMIEAHEQAAPPPDVLAVMAGYAPATGKTTLPTVLKIARRHFVANFASFLLDKYRAA